MNDFQTLSSAGKPNVNFVPSSGKNFQFSAFLVNPLPLLAIPQGLGISFSQSRLESPGKKPTLLPDVDKILNEYAAELLQTLFTIKFIELVNQNFTLLDFSSKNDKLSFGIGLYYKIGNIPLMANDESVRNTLSVYFMDSSFLTMNSVIQTDSAKFNELKKSLQSIDKKYLDKLKQVKYSEGKNSVTLAEKNAQWFIDFAKNGIEKQLSEYLVIAKARTLQNLPDSVINDPRFRPSLTDNRWNEYDATIKSEIAFYNDKFKNSPGYIPLDWLLVKAMVWTEILAGPKGNPVQWSKYPLQIGRFSADAGYSVVKSGRENSDLITTPQLRTQLQSDVTGNNNIKAGIAYLFTIAIREKVSSRDVIDNPAVQTYKIESGNTIDGIVKKLGTTKENIMKNSGLNEVTVGNLKPGQEIKYQTAHSEKYITGWRDWKTAVKDYNGGGDPNYMEKIERAYQIIKSRSY